jgi:predicted nucleotidyltransferase
MIALVDSRKKEIADICRRLAVRRLDVFGSAVGETFDAVRSDIDFVVEFANHNQPGILGRYLALAEGLEALLHRPVDLVTAESIRNPYFRKAVESTREAVYAS